MARVIRVQMHKHILKTTGATIFITSPDMAQLSMFQEGEDEDLKFGTQEDRQNGLFFINFTTPKTPEDLKKILNL